jgi:hypothetical protein
MTGRRPGRDLVAARARARMRREGIPVGTDNPALLAMGAKPLSRQRSPWRHVGSAPTVPGWTADLHVREVGDGMLRALVAEEPTGWHLSISFVDRKGRASRYPRWDEITHARAELLPGDVGFVMHLPPDGEYVAVHDTTFHLHEHPERAS